MLTRQQMIDNLVEVTERVGAAAERTGRDPDAATLVVVTKTRSLAEVDAVIEAGARDLGENYVQELVDKADHFAGAPIRWHAIGHLQKNKVRHVAPVVTLLHSLDSMKLAREVDKRAEAAGREIEALLQVNVAGEDTKFGVDADGALELAPQVAELEHVRLAGLMTMPPFVTDAEDNRPYFAQLRELSEKLIERGVPAECLRQLSMGMTMDYEVAVEEGATLVRVGTGIFGPRE